MADDLAVAVGTFIARRSARNEETMAQTLARYEAARQRRIR